MLIWLPGSLTTTKSLCIVFLDWLVVSWLHPKPDFILFSVFLFLNIFFPQAANNSCGNTIGYVVSLLLCLLLLPLPALHQDNIPLVSEAVPSGGSGTWRTEPMCLPTEAWVLGSLKKKKKKDSYCNSSSTWNLTCHFITWKFWPLHMCDKNSVLWILCIFREFLLRALS